MKWIDSTVGEYCPFVYGKGLPQGKRNQGPFPVYGSNGCVDFHDNAFVKGAGIIIGRKGSVGAIHLSKLPFWPIDTSFYVEKSSIEELQFVYYLLKSLGLEKMNSDTAVPGLNRENAHALPIRIPELESDRKTLGSWLAKFNDKIELNTQTNQTLEEIAQAIFKSWFVDFEPVKAKIATLESGGTQDAAELAAMSAISGKNEAQLAQLKTQDADAYQQLAQTAALFPIAMVESELGEIPEGWGVSEIGDEVDIVGGGTPSTTEPSFWEDGEIHWTTPKDLSNNKSKVLLNTERKITEAGLAKISSGLLPVNTVLMSSRAPVGYLALAKVPVAVNQGYIAMKCNSTLPPEYVILWAESVMDEIQQRASGTTFAEISKKTFRVIPLVRPIPKLAARFKETTAEIFNKIAATEKQSQQLAELRDSLLPKLLSGEIDLSESALTLALSQGERELESTNG